MEKRTKKIVLISTSILLIGGGIFWLWWRNRPKKDETKTDETDTGTTGGGTTGGGLPSSTIDKPSDVLDFQKFANSKGYTPKLVEDGLWGSKTAAAWAKYKTEYSKGSIPRPTSTGSRKKVTYAYFTNPSNMVGKNIYSASNVTGLYNFNLTKIGTAKKDEYLGVVTKVERTSTGSYMLTYGSSLGTAYKVSAESVYFLV